MKMKKSIFWIALQTLLSISFVYHGFNADKMAYVCVGFWALGATSGLILQIVSAIIVDIRFKRKLHEFEEEMKKWRPYSCKSCKADFTFDEIESMAKKYQNNLKCPKCGFSGENA